MSRIEFIQHKDKQILYLDFSELEPVEALQLINDSKPIIAARPEKTVLTLVNVKNTRFDAQLAEGFKEFTVHNKPYVAAGAVYGISGFQKVIYNAAVKLSGRNIPLFDDIERAKDWLVEQ